MKIAILIGAALLGTTGVAASAPAEAQRWNDGWRDGRNDRWDRRDDRRWRGDRNWRDDRGWRGGRDWRDGRRYGWNGGRDRGWGRDRSRIVCRTYDDYYGPVRRCFRVYR